MDKSASCMLLSVSVVLALCVGCGKPKPVVVPASNEPPKPLVMITEAGFPPYEYIENGEVVGVDVDKSHLDGARVGINCRIFRLGFIATVVAVCADAQVVERAILQIGHDIRCAVGINACYLLIVAAAVGCHLNDEAFLLVCIVAPCKSNG